MQFTRPVPVFDPARGLLHNDHYHVGYVTNDIDRAAAVFRDRFGVAEFRETHSETPGGGGIALRSVWLGNMMYEITCGAGPGMELYTRHAPAGGDFVLEFHHYGYLVGEEESWAVLCQRIAADGWEVMLDSDIPGYCRACYVAVPELGHYLEFVLPREGLAERLEATPVA
jgi:catechol 2,3-dioxygenase-like lactoylglutathione lyase family enzyme